MGIPLPTRHNFVIVATLAKIFERRKHKILNFNQFTTVYTYNLKSYALHKFINFRLISFALMYIFLLGSNNMHLLKSNIITSKSRFMDLGLRIRG